MFDLSEKVFCKNVRSARKGGARGPSGMTTDHLRPLLESTKDTPLLFTVAEVLSRERIPDQVGRSLRLGRMTALRKDGGGVRGICRGRSGFGDSPPGQSPNSWGPAVNAATAPFQYAFSTPAGSECIAHALQALTELDPESTITSIDGISAFDTMSRKAMLDGLAQVPGGSAVLPFVRVLMFYSSPSAFLLEADEGTAHTIHQGEGGEQGDALMPLLFCLGQHAALEAMQRELNPNEKFFAFLDDLQAGQSRALHNLVQRELSGHCRIRFHGGKTHVWNRGGTKPEACEVLQRVVESVNPEARVWCGSDVSTEEQGINQDHWPALTPLLPLAKKKNFPKMRVLGAPIGHDDFVRRLLAKTLEKHRVPLDAHPRLCQTCNQRGSCCSTVPLHERTCYLRILRLNWRATFAT